jgi:hypothetical protein
VLPPDAVETHGDFGGTRGPTPSAGTDLARCDGASHLVTNQLDIEGRQGTDRRSPREPT